MDVKTALDPPYWNIKDIAKESDADKGFEFDKVVHNQIDCSIHQLYNHVIFSEALLD